MIKVGCGIKLLKWSRAYKAQPSWIFAKSETFYGYVLLRLRGYKPHRTLFGEVLKKEITRTPDTQICKQVIA